MRTIVTDDLLWVDEEAGEDETTEHQDDEADVGAVRHWTGFLMQVLTQRNLSKTFVSQLKWNMMG